MSRAEAKIDNLISIIKLNNKSLLFNKGIKVSDSNVF